MHKSLKESGFRCHQASVLFRSSSYFVPGFSRLKTKATTSAVIHTILFAQAQSSRGSSTSICAAYAARFSFSGCCWLRATSMSWRRNIRNETCRTPPVVAQVLSGFMKALVSLTCLSQSEPMTAESICSKRRKRTVAAITSSATVETLSSSGMSSSTQR